MDEVIGFVAGIVMLALGIVIANRAISLKFFKDPLIVKAIKIFMVSTFFGGMGALIVGNVVIAVIGIIMGIVGYLVLNALDSP